MTPPSSRRLFLACVFGAALAVAGCNKPAAPAGDADAMSMGDPKAKVHMEEYASVTCSHCAAFNNEVFPAFKARYIDTGQVRYTLHEFLTGPQEVAAAGFMTARCAGKDKYFAVIEDLFRSQEAMFASGDISGELRKVAARAGLSEAQYEACLADKAAANAVSARTKAAIDAGIQATPTFYFNGKKVKEGGMTTEELDAAVAEAAK